MSNLLAITPKECQNLRWQPATDLAFAADQPLMPLHAGELAKAATAMPLALIKQNHRWQLVGVCGLQPDHNLYIRDGQWLGSYRPQWLNIWPFDQLQIKNQLIVTFDRDSGLLSDNGEPFFTADEQPGSALQAIIDQLKQSAPLRQATTKALDALHAAGVIAPWPQPLCDSFGMTIPGLHFIDEKKLLALADSAYVKLRRAMPIAYALNLSIHQGHLLQRFAKHNPRTDTSALPDLDRYFGKDDMFKY